MKIKIIGQDNVGWSIDKDHENLSHFLSENNDVTLTENFLDADIYFFVWYVQVLHPKYILARIFRKLLGKKIIAWVTNDITQNDLFMNKAWPADLWISPNEKISQFLEKNNFKFKKIPFYASPETFTKLPFSREVLSEKLGIDYGFVADKLLIGSFQRDSEGSDLLAPKWQKNPDLLVDICMQLQKDKFVLVLSGPRRHYLIKKCKENNIPFVFVGDLDPIESKSDDIMINNQGDETMNMLYNLIDLYIVTSKSEGGPKAVLEGTLAYTLVVSTDVGFSGEFLHPDLIYSPENLDRVVNIFNNILEKKEVIQDYINHNYSSVIEKLSEKNYGLLISDAVQSVK